MKSISCLLKTTSLFIFGCYITLLAANPVLGETSVKLNWDPNQESDLAGYEVFRGTTSGQYGAPQDVGLKTEFITSNLDPAKIHYFVVRAYDQAGNKSVPSDEVFKSFFQNGGGTGGSFPPPMAEPAPGTTLTSTSITFKGGHTSQDLEHWLWVGSSVGTKDLHNSGSMGTGHTRTVSGLPKSGSIYVQWWTRNSSGWKLSNHTYKMNVASSGGGGGTISFPPPMAEPVPGSTLTSTSVTFVGGHTSQDTAHWLDIGTHVGGNDLHNSGQLSSTTHTSKVSGLPKSGTIYVRWWSLNSSGWKNQDHTYKMNVAGGGGTISFPPPMAEPVPGTTLTSTSVTFKGNHSSQDLEHWLYVGTGVGAKNLYNSKSMGTGHTKTVSGLPKSGTIYVRWWSRNSSGWKSQDHSYTMNVAGGGGTISFPPPMAEPVPGSTLTSTSVTFKGNHSSQDLEHWLYVGTGVGAKNLYNSKSMGTGHTKTVSGLPKSGTIYVRWWSRNSSGWKSQDHTYKMNVGN